MEQEYPLAIKLHRSLQASRRLCLAVVALACLSPSPARAGQTYGPNLLTTGNFESVTATYVPWAGVDDQGNIHGLEGKQIGVGDDGNITGYSFGPSMAVGDLNGDGKLDLVIADSKGFFWFFPNSGTPEKPLFTQGEVIPIWLGEDRIAINTEGVDNVVPRIQLADLEGNSHLDIVAGTYAGKFFRIHNIGTSTQPNFKPTLNRDILLMNTRRKGVLWSNYLAPCLTSLFSSSNVLDLVMGEGTYSANSIYLLTNRGASSNPYFDEDHIQKIIPGMGLEQLTPVVVDWNNDGKPDIICGSRTGFLNLYLNNSTDPQHPTFTPGTHLKIAGAEKLGGSITVTVGDLTGNHLPNLLIGTDDGTVLYALNTGKLGAPEFSTTAMPIKGTLPPTYHYTSPNDWHKDGAWGAPDELLACVNPKLEPGFAFPDGVKSKYSLKFYVWPVTNTWFPERYYPPIEDYLREHVIWSVQNYTLKLNKPYRIHFWIKADRNLANLRYHFIPAWSDRAGFHGYEFTTPVNAGGSGWTEVSDEFKIRNPDDPSVTDWQYHLEFRFTGQATFYLDDVQIQEEL